MLIAEELLLVCLDADSGRPRVGRRRLGPALGAALVVELVLRERISIAPSGAERSRRGRVELISAVPTDDAELDWILDHLQTWTNVKASQLVAELAGPRVVDRLADRLVDSATLAVGPGTRLGNRTWPTRDPGPGQEIRVRIHAGLIARAEPTERTVALIALLASIGSLASVVRVVDPGVDPKVVRQRTEDLCRGDWAARTVRDVMASSLVQSFLFSPSRT